MKNCQFLKEDNEVLNEYEISRFDKRLRRKEKQNTTARKSLQSRNKRLFIDKFENWLQTSVQTLKESQEWRNVDIADENSQIKD